MYIDIDSSDIPSSAAAVWMASRGIVRTDISEAFIAGYTQGFKEFSKYCPREKSSHTPADEKEARSIKKDFLVHRMSVKKIAEKYDRTIHSVKGILRKQRAVRNHKWTVPDINLVLYLRFDEQESPEEISAKTGWSVGSIKQYIKEYNPNA